MKTANKVESVRSFGGKIDNFTDKQERAFEKAHLKAYLKGHKVFFYGFIDHPVTGQRIRAQHNVKEIWRAV